MRRHRGVDVSLARFARSLAAAAALAALAPTVGRAQERGTLLGTVRDFGTGRPVVGASVQVEGTRTSATTDAVGRYWLLNLQPGAIRLRISGPGYVAYREHLVIREGEDLVAHFHLQSAAILLERLEVMGQAARPAAQPTASLRDEAAVPVSLVELLDRVAPGLAVVRGSGQLGTGTRIGVRGAKSLVAPAPPLIFVDGVRVEYATTSAGPGTTGASVLDLLDPAVIDSIRVLRGAEAARYGLGAQNGVILITTIRGGAARP